MLKKKVLASDHKGSNGIPFYYLLVTPETMQIFSLIEGLEEANMLA